MQDLSETYCKMCLFMEQIYQCTRTTDTQWRHKSKVSEKLGRCGRQNMLCPYLKIWDWDWNFGRAVKPISSLGVLSPYIHLFPKFVKIWMRLEKLFGPIAKVIVSTAVEIPSKALVHTAMYICNNAFWI